MNEIEEYETHEAWLARQRETLKMIDDTIEEINARHGEAPPRVLAPLPWWKDEHRINGEAARVVEALKFAWEVIKAVIRALLRAAFRGRFSPAVILVVVLVALFGLGWMLSGLGV